jgi:hypothetical protein
MIRGPKRKIQSVVVFPLRLITARYHVQYRTAASILDEQHTSVLDAVRMFSKVHERGHSLK